MAASRIPATVVREVHARSEGICEAMSREKKQTRDRMTTKGPCQAPNCDRTRVYRLYCTKHHRQVKKHGRIMQPKVMHDWCTAPGCEARANRRGAGLCEKHYMRLRRNGQFESIAKRAPDAECKADGCSKRASRIDGFCRNCGLRFDRNGDTEHRVGYLHSSWLGFDEVSYGAIHQRLRKWRGAARLYKCVDCNRQGAHWSYSHRSPFEREELLGKYIVQFSPIVSDYVPRCARCHKRFDLAVRSFSWGRALPAA